MSSLRHLVLVLTISLVLAFGATGALFAQYNFDFDMRGLKKDQSKEDSLFRDIRPSYKLLEDQEFINSVPRLQPEDGFRPLEDPHNSFVLQDFSLSKSSSKTFLGLNYPSYTVLIAPTLLIAGGVWAQESHALINLNTSTRHEVSEHIDDKIGLDDYLQFAPAVAVYGLNMAGVKGKHNLKDRTIVLATSYLIMGTTVYTVKSTTNVLRPDGSSKNSFPSGHTATAFAGAQFLFREYQDVSPWIGVAGYAAATTTGMFRVLNNRHWLSDVAAGAGIGILSTEVSYMLLPLFQKVFPNKNDKRSLAVFPSVYDQGAALGMVCRF